MLERDMTLMSKEENLLFFVCPRLKTLKGQISLVRCCYFHFVVVKQFFELTLHDHKCKI